MGKHQVVRLSIAILTSLAIFVGILAAIHALRLLIIGIPITTVGESPLGEPLVTAPEVTFQEAPYLPAIIPLLASLSVITGLLISRMVLVWAGIGVLTVYFALFLFSSGGGFLVMIIPLIVLIGTIQLLKNRFGS